MSKKKWHENIPAGGVLVNWLDSVIRIMSYDDDGCVFDDSGDCYVMSDVEYMRPLTAAEWWDFAPWQDIKDAKKDMLFLALLKNGNVIPAYISSEHGDIGIRLVNGEIDEIYPVNYFKGWLPIPQVSK